jgi:hypothetical protein
MSDAVLTEISTALGDIVAHLDGKKGDATADRLLEISTALGEMVAMMEDKRPVDVAPLVAAIKALKLTVTATAPTVKVDVKPTPVNVSPAPIYFTPPPMPAAPPAQVVVQHPSGRVVQIKFKTDRYGNIDTADLVWKEPTPQRATRKTKD